MSCYQWNRYRLLREVKGRYHNGSEKEKAAEYYQNNQEALKEKARNKYRDLSDKEKEAK